MCHGYGTFKHICGDRYEGEWRDGAYHGQGTFQYATGHVFAGQFKKNSIQGVGTMAYVDGRVKVGHFKENADVGEAIAWESDGMTAWKLLDGRQVGRVSPRAAQALQAAIFKDGGVSGRRLIANPYVV